ncbi:MAG: IS4/Tn5 family transposase DNA-binding protein [Waterburya sp.]
MSWAKEELARADLGDLRRNKRLVLIVSDLAGKPHESVPQASRDTAYITYKNYNKQQQQWLIFFLLNKITVTHLILYLMSNTLYC